MGKIKLLLRFAAKQKVGRCFLNHNVFWFQQYPKLIYHYVTFESTKGEYYVIVEM